MNTTTRQIIDSIINARTRLQAALAARQRATQRSAVRSLVLNKTISNDHDLPPAPVCYPRYDDAFTHEQEATRL
jgi:hypothetical protein